MAEGKKEEQKRRSDPGIAFLLVGVLYLAVVGYFLAHSDWNPRTPNYCQFLVNTAGKYSGGVALEDSYAFITVSDDNVARFVVTDVYGEILSAYDLSPAPISVFLRGDVLYFVFADGNRLQIMKYTEGEFSTATTVSTGWEFVPLGSPRIIESTPLLFAKYGNSRGVVVADIEGNELSPLTLYFCNGCSLSTDHLLPDGAIFGRYGGQAMVIRPGESGVTATLFRTYKPFSITDICGDIFVGYASNQHLVVGSFGANRLYEMNIAVNQNPICYGKKLFFSSSDKFVEVSLGPELNDYGAYAAPSYFQPFGAFEDAPYLVIYGEGSGNPSFLRNVVTDIKCPESFQQLDLNLNPRSISIDVENAEILRKKELRARPADPFVGIQEVTLDEDFRCYRP